jgi:hypothetical protein
LINPPYGEAGNARTRTRKGSENEVQHKAGVNDSKVKQRFTSLLGGAALTEKYVQFFVRTYYDIPDCKIAAFVKPKYICGTNMTNFRTIWKARYLGGFATPSMTHDNCTGEYPICLFIWDLAEKENFPENVPCDIFTEKNTLNGVKKFYPCDGNTINDWLAAYNNAAVDDAIIGTGRCDGPDMQRDSYCWIEQKSDYTSHWHAMRFDIQKKNLVPFMVYFAVRHSVPHVWINDSDRYLFPNKKWERNIRFQNNCIVFTLFNSYNKIKLREGVNHWIPFNEDEVGSKKRFESRFMSDFLKERAKLAAFGREAQAVLEAGRKLWRYYLGKGKTDIDVKTNAAFYDIREYFQGSKSGRMSNDSDDKTYNELIQDLRDAQAVLAESIKEKAYEYEFLK